MDVEGNGRLRFGDYELDSRAGKLLRDGRPVKIQPQPLRVLSILLEHPGQIVSREQLRARIWGDATFVEFDQGLNYCIRQIRLALHEEASEPVYIETLPKQGYRFITHALPAPPAVLEAPPAQRRDWKILGAAICFLILAGAGVLISIMRRPAIHELDSYTQITSFTDAAVAPALSPDGRMVAFYRSDRTFFIPGQIYAKMLPDGEPVPLTHDPRLKYNLAFSPDGSRIAYTVFEKGWQTYTVPSLGGESTLLLPNAAGLTWLDRHHVLFSEINTGVHMGIVTAAEDRSEHHEVYFPKRERGMAHYSYPSPDRNWALVVEMDPEWQPCRLVPLSGVSAGRRVGPSGACTSAAWSRDGTWMYFGAEVAGKQHLWRQRFPDGQPERITSGYTEENGLALDPDGRSLITSIFTKQNAVWIHDSAGDHALSTEGYADAAPLRFSADGKRLYYLLRRDSPESPSELWRADVDSGKSEVVVPGLSMREFDISKDEKDVVFSTQPAGGSSQLWLAPWDRSVPPRMISGSGDASPHFGAEGEVLFRLADGKDYFLAKMRADGSGRTKILPAPILDLFGTSPDGRFAVVGAPLPGSKTPGVGHIVAVAVDGGSVRRIASDFSLVSWSPDGKNFCIGMASATLVIPIPAGHSIPDLPASGIDPTSQAPAVPGSKIVEQVGIVPGLGSTYAYVKPTMHANLFRIPLR